MTREFFEAFDGQQDTFGYSQAVRAGDTIYVAGTLGVAGGLTVPDDMADQMELAYRNVARTLARFGADLSHVVDQKAYVTDMDAAMATTGVRRPLTAGPACPPAPWSRSAGSPCRRPRPRSASWLSCVPSANGSKCPALCCRLPGSPRAGSPYCGARTAGLRAHLGTDLERPGRWHPPEPGSAGEPTSRPPATEPVPT
jgi:enamine deaminase RidA (YjgF/YER057c/UK114 family)